MKQLQFRRNARFALVGSVRNNILSKSTPSDLAITAEGACGAKGVVMIKSLLRHPYPCPLRSTRPYAYATLPSLLYSLPFAMIIPLAKLHILQTYTNSNAILDTTVLPSYRCTPIRPRSLSSVARKRAAYNTKISKFPKLCFLQGLTTASSGGNAPFAMLCFLGFRRDFISSGTFTASGLCSNNA
jgi:hypothetical protein